MKPFPTAAHRRRARAAALRAAGLAATAAAAAWLGVELFPPAPAAPLTLPPAASAPAPRPDAADLVAAFAARPLRPPAPVLAAPPPPAPPPPPKPPEVELVATLVNPGQPPRAFVRSKAAGRLLTVEAGSRVDGATVTAVRDGQVVLDVGGREVVLKVGRPPS